MMKAKPITNKIEKFLHTMNRTQTELAEEMGVSQSLVTLWIQGKRVPGTSKLKKLSEITGIPIKDLI